MVRWIALSLLGLLLTACGGDDEKGGTDAAQGGTDAGRDGSVADAGSDAQPAKPDQVTNPGAACRTANTCTGAAPSCQTMLSLLGQEIPFPGGYCSAPCKNNVECGPTGECPVGESLKALTSIPFITADIRGLIETAAPSHCYERCTMDSQCRTTEGYRCASIVSALTEGAGQAGLNVAGLNVSMFLSGPIVESKYCLPPAPQLPDAGGADAGAPSDAGSDAASADAGSADAGSDAATTDTGASDAQNGGG